MDFNKQYRQDELAPDLYNAGNGDTRNYNGQQVRVINNGNGTRSLQPLSATEQALNSAKQVRDFNIQSNQPAIQSLQASKNPLQDRYANLLSTIKNNQGAAENRQTLTTNNELGRRGISNNSGVYQQEMTNAVNPVTQQYTGQYQDAIGQQNTDMSNIDKAIAQLQTGDPSAAFSGAMGIGQQEQQANQFNQSQKQQASMNSANNANALALAQLQNERFKAIGAGGLYDPISGQVIQGQKPQAAGGGVVNNGW